jgi:hypothetical protein
VKEARFEACLRKTEDGEDNLSYVDFDFDVFQSNNGYNGDNEEYELLILFTTCCKIVTM